MHGNVFDAIDEERHEMPAQSGASRGSERTSTVNSTLSKDGRGVPIPKGRTIIDFEEGHAKHVENSDTWGRVIAVPTASPLGVYYEDVPSVDEIETWNTADQIENFRLLHVNPDAPIRVKIGNRPWQRINAESSRVIIARPFDRVTVDSETACAVRGFVSNNPSYDTRRLTFGNTKTRLGTTWDTAAGDTQPSYASSRFYREVLSSTSSSGREKYSVPYIRVGEYDELTLQVRNKGSGDVDVTVEGTTEYGPQADKGDFNAISGMPVTVTAGTTEFLTVSENYQHITVKVAENGTTGDSTGQIKVSARREIT